MATTATNFPSLIKGNSSASELIRFKLDSFFHEGKLAQIEGRRTYFEIESWIWTFFLDDFI